MKIFKMLTALAAFFAVALFSGCDDDKGSEPDPQPVKLASPGIVFTGRQTHVVRGLVDGRGAMLWLFRFINC